MGWDGMGWDGMGWDGMGWDGMACWLAGHCIGLKPLGRRELYTCRKFFSYRVQKLHLSESFLI